MSTQAMAQTAAPARAGGSALWVMARLTWREAARRKIALAAYVLGLGFLVLYGLGLYLIFADTPVQGITENTPPVLRRIFTNVFMMMGLYAANWLMVLVTVLCSVDTLSGEISSGVMQTLATKPLPRWKLVVGKYLGFAAMLTPFLLMLSGGVLLEVWLISRHFPPAVIPAVALMWLESMLLLAVSFRAGASLSTLATGIVVFGMHMCAFVGGWIEEIGSIARSQTAVNIGIVASLVMPSEAMWRKAGSFLQGPVLGGSGRTLFSFTSVPSDAMVIYAALYMMVAVGLAVHRFSKRDL